MKLYHVVLFRKRGIKQHGVNIVIYANQLTRSAFPAMQEMATDILKYHRAEEADARLMPIKDIITLIDELKLIPHRADCVSGRKFFVQKSTVCFFHLCIVFYSIHNILAAAFLITKYQTAFF